MSSPDGCGGPHERAFRQLQKALAACRKHKAKLVIAKLDRLSRNLAFIATLMDSNVEFIAADNPHANRLTVHILAAVAEHEREQSASALRPPWPPPRVAAPSSAARASPQPARRPSCFYRQKLLNRYGASSV